MNAKFNKNGSLGKRANKLDKGILTIRFEMPFNVTCRKCDHAIARGVRFNAEKKLVGKYHSTPIYSFRMLTSCCANTIEIHTDPKAAEYVVVEGADRRVGGAGAGTRYDDDDATADAAGQRRPGLDLEGTIEVELQTREERDEMMADPFARLERGAVSGDVVKAKAAAPTLLELKDASKERW